MSENQPTVTHRLISLIGEYRGARLRLANGEEHPILFWAALEYVKSEYPGAEPQGMTVEVLPMIPNNHGRVAVYWASHPSQMEGARVIPGPPECSDAPGA